MATYLRYKGVAAVAPASVSPPSFTGATTSSATLIGNTGQVSGTPTPALTVQWYRVDATVDATVTAISGATSLSYTLTNEDIGYRIQLWRTATNGVGSPLVTKSAISEVVVAIVGSDIQASSFGAKTSKTTGGMNVGEFTLTVADATGFAVGDQVIVENPTGPGTRGVGGCWPATIYASKAAMDADKTKANNTYATIAGDTADSKFGSLHRYNASTQTWNIYNNTEYKEPYWDRAEPFSLVAKITAKAGNVLTLDLPAQISVANVNVYFDNWPLFGPLGIGANRLQNKTLIFGVGEYAFSRPLRFDTCAEINIKGAGKTLTKLVSPKCTPSIGIEYLLCTGSCSLRDLTMVGNVRDTGYGTGTLPTQPQDQLRRFFVTAFYPNRCYNGPTTCENVDFIDPWQSFGGSYSSGMHAINSKTTSPGHKCYIQWFYQFSDHGQACSATDCQVFSDAAVGAFESFYGTGATFTRCGGINALFSANSAAQFLFDECYTTIKAGSQKSPPGNFGTLGFASEKIDVFNINNNIGNSGARDNLGGAGEVRNANIVIEGPINLTTGAVPNPFTIAPNIEGVKITGTYGQDTVNPKGYVQMPVVTDNYDGRRGVKSDSAPGATVSGMRFVGGRPESWSYIINLINGAYPSGKPGSLVKNTIVDAVVRVNATTETNLISNADFNAKGAAYNAWLAAAQANP